MRRTNKVSQAFYNNLPNEFFRKQEAKASSIGHMVDYLSYFPNNVCAKCGRPVSLVELSVTRHITLCTRKHAIVLNMPSLTQFDT
jgi:hypothetical protein